MFIFYLKFYNTGVFTPMRIKTVAGTKDYYVDGGVLCNFPLHAYDGKYASDNHFQILYFQNGCLSAMGM